MKSIRTILAFSLLCLPLMTKAADPGKKGNYDNFKVSIYTRAYEVQNMTDPAWLDSTWNIISSQMKVDKIYLLRIRGFSFLSGPVFKSEIGATTCGEIK